MRDTEITGHEDFRTRGQSVVEHAPELSRERVRAERLGQESLNPLLERLLVVLLEAVAARNDDAHLGVDPAQLAPALQSDPYVRHKRMPAEVYLKKCRTQFDLIVNDMLMDAQDSARLMVAYSSYLHEDGNAIMTVKLRDRNLRRVMDHTFRILRKAYRVVRVRQLAYNRSEVTVYLKKLG